MANLQVANIRNVSGKKIPSPPNLLDMEGSAFGSSRQLDAGSLGLHVGLKPREPVADIHADELIPEDFTHDLGVGSMDPVGIVDHAERRHATPHQLVDGQ